MMDKLIEEVKELVEKEYGRASAHYGPTHNSDHESYAILVEEIEEAEEEIHLMNSALTKFWQYVKDNSTYVPFRLNSLKLVYDRAMYGACELIQVAAMAKKAQMTILDKAAADEFKGD